MGDKVTKEGEHVAGKRTSHQENNSLEFQNIFSLQYLLPHFSHLISTSLVHFSHFGGEVKDSSRLSTLAKATHGNEWEGRISNRISNCLSGLKNPVPLSVIVKMKLQHVLRGEENSGCREENVEVHRSVSFNFEKVGEIPSESSMTCQMKVLFHGPTLSHSEG